MSCDRRELLRIGTLSSLGVLTGPMLNFGRCRLFARPPVEVSSRAVDLVARSRVIDMLGLLTLDWERLYAWQREPEAFAEPDYRKLEAAGVNVLHPAVETSARDPHRAARIWLEGWNRLLGHRVCFFTRVDSIIGLLRVPRRGRIGVVLGFQNASHFRTPADVALFWELGQRVCQLTYNQRNRLGSGAYAGTDGGLTSFGGEIVEAMNRIGMAIDISHCGERTSLDAIAVSRRPVLVTHSNAQALVPGQPRCKSDRVIRRLAAAGGVMGITMVQAFVSRRRPATLDDLVDHFDHVARLVGVEHLGLGSDIDVDAADPETGRANPIYAIRGVYPPARVYQLTDALLARGWSEEDVELVLGRNFLRVLARIWPRHPPPPLPAEEPFRDPFCPAPAPVRVPGA